MCDSLENVRCSIEALKRTLHEIQALSAIYHAIDDETLSTNINILTVSEYELARNLIEKDLADLQDDTIIPELRVEINLKLSINTVPNDNSCQNAKIHVTLPKGYPKGASAHVSIVSITNVNSSRNQRDNFASSLNKKSKELSELDCEALLELIQYAQENANNYLISSTSTSSAGSPINGITEEEIKQKDEKSGRRWIWVHHITNNERCKDIVQEARILKLSGYLKHGYPGIVVVEGNNDACNEYVQWIKGNKSRPGGFGRNWGHHVRGELVLESDCSRAFTNIFEDIGEDLAKLSKVCRDIGVEDEFKKYVMQH